MLCEMQSVQDFELVSSCPTPMTITITPRAPPLVYGLNSTAIALRQGWMEIRLRTKVDIPFHKKINYIDFVPSF